MRWYHVAQQQFHRLSHRYALLRRISTTTTLLTLLWLYTLYWGERSAFKKHIRACSWDQWEKWPREAAPHHLAFIADPQLVDPHTYPGRPWPLSDLTETYTDMYMSRSYRLINERLDPDSIVFLGDLFDGGREWAPEKAKHLEMKQRKYLEELGVLKNSKGKVNKKPNVHMSQEDKRAFMPGENGRWMEWDYRQWYKDLARFTKIFYTPDQVYPGGSHRALVPAYNVPADPVAIENGANPATWQEYATKGKARQIISSLPGNHDLGFGAGVQLVVRDRYESHFGPGNRIDVFGNHTFVSVDVPSLSARSQYMGTGFESDAKHYEAHEHIWQPTMDFLDNLTTPAKRVISDALGEYYPVEHKSKGWQHEVTDPQEVGRQSANSLDEDEKFKNTPQLPVVLLSHVPLFRNPDVDCGPLREGRPAIDIAMGYQYQNVLTQAISKDVVNKVSMAGDIAMIFSGDDHDYCDIVHRYNIPIPGTKSYFPHDDSLKARFEHIREITVKSFSWAMGVRKPGFLLVSLWNPVDAQGQTLGTPLPTIQTHLCLLPDQLSIFIHYAILLLLTAPALLALSLYRAFQPSEPTTDDFSPPSSPTKQNLPQFQVNGSTHLAPPKSRTHTRASSSLSTSAHDTSHLGIQRNHNARTRSVSPVQQQQQQLSPLIDKAGFFSSHSDDSDEESNLGSDAGGNNTWTDFDSQGKWKWRRRREPGRARRALGEFVVNFLVVGVPGLVWYFWLVWRG